MSEKISATRVALIRLQSSVAKHNASIRRRFPPSHALRLSLEQSISGTINDMPSQIWVFVGRAEDAACCCDAIPGDPLSFFTDGLAELVDEAHAWAGPSRLNDKGSWAYAKNVSIIEEHLLEEIARAAQAFFLAVYAIPRVRVVALARAEGEFWMRYQRAQQALSRASKDNEPTLRIAGLLVKRVPVCVAAHVLSFFLCGTKAERAAFAYV